MATGDTSQTMVLSSSPPPPLDYSPSNLSSPLSDVEDEDKDGPEDLGLGISAADSSHSKPHKNEEDNHEGEDGACGPVSDEELSEADINDSEAETERLYDTPPKNNGTRDIVVNGATVGRVQQLADPRDRIFERSPSKLQQQIRPEPEADHEASERDLSEDEQEDNDDVSLPPSDTDARPHTTRAPRSASPVKGTVEESGTTFTVELLVTKDARQPSTESRKRKRSSAADRSDSDEPSRKRTGSVAVPDNELSPDENAVIDDEVTMTNPQTAEHSPTLEHHDAPEVATKDKEEPNASIEEEAVELIRPKKSKRVSAKKRKSPDEGDGGGDEEGAGPHDEAEGASVNNAPHPADDENHEAEVDEEAEAAHKEEELERKKAAWEELTAIEKQFTNFRERLYQERLEQLNREEAMLTSPNPTHPEYLAMVQCLNERRDERIRLSDLELQLKTDVLKKRAVAERAQILSQFYQSVRESREKVLEALGQDWYAIQSERRRQANNIPDYGLRLPSQKTQTVKNAIAYNKEVSILSGFAKHVGFPAAPNLGGASEDQADQDLEAIHRARQTAIEHVPHYSAPPFHRELSANLPFGRIGPAGEQFIEQTPWANPNHPSHHIQRQAHHGSKASHSAAGPSLSAPRRHSHQPAAVAPTSAAALVNGESSTQMHKSYSSAGHESVKASRITTENLTKRDTATTAF